MTVNGISKICLTGLFVAFLSATAIGASSNALATAGSGAKNDRLEASASPYLRSHSKDLVRWYPWGAQAFSLARERGVPVMVSFGYTACHWCHVMQETHFNNPGIAKSINEQFVPVLVDRERRTTLDESYMLVTEALTQRGGWPNTVFMTADRQPFYGTGYIPPEDFVQLMGAVTAEWVNNRQAVVAEGARLSTMLTGYLTRKEDARALTPEVLSAVTKSLTGQFDPFSGGIGEGPKFFRASVLMYLLGQAERTGDAAALEAVERTLQSILSGGIHDHIEGGFHRYAVDPRWRVPHFEKMLYDQAQVAEVFTTAFRITGKPAYAATARKTLDYVLADLTDPEGGFYAARDADSEGEEGTYYVWTPDQLERVLGAKDAKFALETFGTVPDGEFAGKVILNLDNVAGEATPRLIEMFRKLRKVRAERPAPVRDEKVLASWNGMTIRSFAAAAATFGEPRYREAAAKAGNMIWQKMRGKDGRLKRSFFAGAEAVEGELDDYAHLARGFVSLFDLTQDRTWFDRAVALSRIMIEDFADEDAGDFYATRTNQGYGRIKPRSDVDQPSGNAAALDVLARLSRRSPDPVFRNQAEKAIAALSGIALKAPVGGVSVLSAADRFLRGEREAIQYAGQGVARVAMTPSIDNDKLVLRVTLAEGWHINSEQPLDKDLIATRLEVSAQGKKIGVDVGYPKATVKTLDFSDAPVALLENSFEISARIQHADAPVVDASLEVQACSNEVCLLPEILTFKVVRGAARLSVRSN